MMVTGMSYAAFVEVFDKVNADDFNGNLMVKDYRTFSDNRFRVSLRTVKSTGPGTRISWSGRKTIALSWEAFRDVFIAVFSEYPNARIQTSMAVYKGIDSFYEEYPKTAFINVGSMMSPAYMQDLTN